MSGEIQFADAMSVAARESVNAMVAAKGTPANAPEETFDLDLFADDAKLREAVGDPTRIKLKDGTAVYVTHVAAWSSAAMDAASKGNWDDWADEVIDDEEQNQAFKDANLAAYQLNAIFETCGKSGGVGQGKSKRSRR